MSKLVCLYILQTKKVSFLINTSSSISFFTGITELTFLLFLIIIFFLPLPNNTLFLFLNMSNFSSAFKKIYLIILYSGTSLEAAYSMLTLHFALVNLMTHHLVYS